MGGIRTPMALQRSSSGRAPALAAAVALLAVLLAAPLAAASSGAERKLLTNPLASCYSAGNCEGKTISSIACCYDGACISSLEFGFAPSTQPDKDATCSSTCADGTDTHALLVGEVITGYTVGRSSTAKTGCMQMVEFLTNLGNTYTCLSPNARSGNFALEKRGSAAAASDAADDGSRPRHLLGAPAMRRPGRPRAPRNGTAPGAAATSPVRGPSTALSGRGAYSPRYISKVVAPKKVPSCMKKRARNGAPFGELCSLRRFSCTAGGPTPDELRDFTPQWGFHPACGLTQEQAQWQCTAPLTCAYGTTVDPATDAACATALPNSPTVTYVDAAGNEVTSLDCPAPGTSTALFGAVVEDGTNCTYYGPEVVVTGECPPAPTLTCGAPPTCDYAGQVVSLAGVCTVSGLPPAVLPSAQLRYTTATSPSATTVTCPAPGAPLDVTATASAPTLPQCAAALAVTTEAFQVESNCPAPAGAKVECAAPPVCQTEGQVISLDGLCFSPLAGATVKYIVNGAEATSYTCSSPNRPAEEVAVVVEYAGANGATCTYPDQPPITILPSTCAAPSAVTFTCGAAPVCQTAGAANKTVSPTLCSVTGVTGSLQYYVDGAQSDTYDCPPLGGAVTIQPRVVTSAGCIYTGPTLTVTSKCADPTTLSVTCTAPDCPNQGYKVSLAGSCTSASGGNIGYKVGASTVTTATCPAVGGTVTVKAFLSGIGDPSCTYPALATFTLASTCPAQPSLSCSPLPACRFAGDLVKLTGTCSASAGTVAYYSVPDGAQITEVNCGAPGSDPVVIEPRVTAGGCTFSTYAPVSLPAADCPSATQARISCTRVACPKAGATVSLTGTCTTALTGATITYYTNGVVAQGDTLVCGNPGEPVQVQPAIVAYNDNPGCTYSGAAYNVSTPCPSAEAAALSCAEPVCDQPGKVIALSGYCSSALAGANVVTKVNGVTATSLTCPAVGTTLVLTATISGYAGSCAYASAPVNVTSACGTTPETLTCGDFVCPAAGETLDLTTQCQGVGTSVAFKLGGQTVTSVTCPPPGATLDLTAVVTDSGCDYTSTSAVTSDCYSNAGASFTCADVYCASGDTADFALAGCSSPYAPTGTVTYSEAEPYTCPAGATTVTATLSDGACTYTAAFQVGQLTCSPGQYPTYSGGSATCVDCGYGYYCPSGQTQLACTDFYTTNTTTATSAAECQLGACDPCTTDPNPPVYFTTGGDMSIWYTSAWQQGGQVDKCCQFNTTEFDTINDIAIDANGDLIVIVRKGSTKSSGRMIKVKASAVQPPDATRTCEYETLISGGFPDPLNPSIIGNPWAGLGAGQQSNIMYGCSGDAIFTVDVSTNPPTYLGTLPTGLAGGPADITLGPDGNLYLAQRTEMYRIGLDADGITPTNITQINSGSYGLGLAGAFCTSTEPIATGSGTTHPLWSMYSPFTSLGGMTLDVAGSGFSGAATVPDCH